MVSRTEPPPPLLSMRGIRKSFQGVPALRGVDLNLMAGEVLAVVGENGAGKSTLMKILAGAHRADGGALLMDGREARIQTPLDARAAGIAIIYQEFNLVPTLTVRENIFLGREQRRNGLACPAEETRAVRALFERLGLTIDPEARCDRLPVAQQQAVEIARALSVDARLIVMDEPTAALTDQEVQRLFGIVRDLQARGIAILYVSHRLDEVFALADRVLVLRDGAQVGTHPVETLTREALIEQMVGRPLDQEFPRQAPTLGSVRLRVSGLTRGTAVRAVSFSARAGEIVGITGLVGAGRTELVRLLFGADRAERGRIELEGRPLALRTPRDAIAHRIALLTEDRKEQGLILRHSVLDNFALPNLDRYRRLGLLRHEPERSALAGYVERLQIKLAGPAMPAGHLSGGNQQKVVLAKWLERNCDLVIFDEPTRGIDVGAKVEIYHLMNRLAAEGKTILMVSSELPEVLGMSHRVLVMFEGRITGEIRDPAAATQAQVLRLAMGGRETSSMEAAP